MADLTLAEACAVLGLSRGTVRGLADLGDLPCRRTPGGHRRFTEEDVLAYRERGIQPRRGGALREAVWLSAALTLLRQAEADLGALDGGGRALPGGRGDAAPPLSAGATRRLVRVAEEERRDQDREERDGRPHAVEEEDADHGRAPPDRQPRRRSVRRREAAASSWVEPVPVGSSAPYFAPLSAVATHVPSRR